MSDVLPQQLRIQGNSNFELRRACRDEHAQTIVGEQVHGDRRVLGSALDLLGQPFRPYLAHVPTVRIVHPAVLRHKFAYAARCSRLEVALALEQRFQPHAFLRGDARFVLQPGQAFDLISRMLIRARFQIAIVQRLFGAVEVRAIASGRSEFDAARYEVAQFFGF